MFELPLFPLNTVLFPGMPLALHIFEERYKLMIGQCINERRPFGVVLIKDGLEASGPLAEPYEVGCTAEITETQALPEGRMNIGALGRERFRILSLDRDRPYLVGRVERYPLAITELLDEADRRLRPWVAQYLALLSQLEGVELDPDQLPDDPIVLAYLAAALLQVSAKEKQQLLNLDAAEELLTEVRALYRREVAFVKAMFERRSIEGEDTFSLN